MSIRDPQCHHDPNKDRLTPLKPLDLSAITTMDELLQGYGNTAFGARRLGEGADVLEAMVRDPDCFTVLTLSGAMTVAKMGLVICEMIDRGYIDAIISTGALMTHGLVESAGYHHYKAPDEANDKQLFEQGYNRVYDTLEPEINLDRVEKIVQTVLEGDQLPEILSSRTLSHAIGQQLHITHPHGRGPLISAYRRKVPIYIPALTDSELGLDIAVHNHRLRKAGNDPLRYDPFLDLDDYARRAQQAKRLGIMTIGGGVPRNYAQQVGPYLEIRAHRSGEKNAKPVRFQYGLRICPEPDHLGGLSGCTYREGISWGKFIPPDEGGRFAEIFSDATIAWPLLVKAVMERIPFKTQAT
ncbi:MAG: deoxyhypusine synthase family protein [Magnetococcales bacterium]|nr:deoxyhypusine synthase family protein [Magnetococcales bacterium]